MLTIKLQQWAPRGREQTHPSVNRTESLERDPQKYSQLLVKVQWRESSLHQIMLNTGSPYATNRPPTLHKINSKWITVRKVKYRNDNISRRKQRGKSAWRWVQWWVFKYNTKIVGPLKSENLALSKTLLRGWNDRTGRKILANHLTKARIQHIQRTFKAE